jgi:hypothetical protein
VLDGVVAAARAGRLEAEDLVQQRVGLRICKAASTKSLNSGGYLQLAPHAGCGWRTTLQATIHRLSD